MHAALFIPKLRLSIVFIHGLNGSPIGTWSKGSTFWPSALLPSDYPASRILTYGHLASRDIPAKSARKAPARSIKSLGETLVSDFEAFFDASGPVNAIPTVFVCYSLGGIILKHALSDSRRVPRGDSRRALAESVGRGGILFLGVPHRGGAPLADFGRKMAKLAKVVGVHANEALAKKLMNDSEELRDGLRDFPYAVKELNVHYESFYEDEETKGVGKIVDEFSASLYGGERVACLPGTHSGMCKFGSRDEEGYQAIISAIGRCVKRSHITAPRKTAVQDRVPIISMQAAKVQKFCGREEDLKAIEAALAQSTQKVPIVVLQGIGGQGKTQLALEYCERQHRAGRDVFWIDATEERTAVQGYEQLLEIIGSDSLRQEMHKKSGMEIVQTMRSLLSNRKDKWILVFDNQDDPERFPNFSSFFPTSYIGAGQIIITSRHPESVRYGTALPVGKMAEKDAIELFFSQCNIAAEKLSNSSREAAAKIVELLCYLPLAIDQAASYVRTTGMKLEDFPSFYDREREAVLKHTSEYWEYKKILDSEERAVSTSAFVTWELSFSQINKSGPKASNRASVVLDSLSSSGQWMSPLGYLLTLCAFFCHNSITEEAIKAGLKKQDRAPWLQAVALNDDGTWSSSRFLMSMGKLVNSSLIQRNEKSDEVSFTIHGLVQQWIKLRLPSFLRKEFTKEAFEHVKILAQEASKSAVKLKHDQIRLLVMQLDASAFNAKRFLGPEDGLVEKAVHLAKIFKEHKQILSAIDLFKFALNSLEDSMRDLQTQLTEDLTNVIRLKVDIAMEYQKFGKYELAAEYYKDALPRISDDPSSPFFFAWDSRAMIESRMAVCLEKANLIEEAHALFQKLVADIEEADAENRKTKLSIWSVVKALHYLAENFVQRGLYVGTLAAQQMAVEGYSAIYGPSLGTSSAMFNLGKNQRLQNLHMESLETMNKVLPLFEKHLGETHPWILNTVENIGLAHIALKDYASASEIYAKYYALFEQRLGEIHDLTLRAASMYVSAQAMAGDVDDALRVWHTSIMRSQARFSGEEQTVLRKRLAEAWALYMEDRRMEARREYAGLKEALGGQLGKGSVVVLSLSQILDALGDGKDEVRMEVVEVEERKWSMARRWTTLSLGLGRKGSILRRRTSKESA